MPATATETRNFSNHARPLRNTGIAVSEPIVWIKQGIADFKRIPGLSLLYGILFSGLCAGIFYLTQNAPWYTLAYITGLAFVGPFLAAGLYAASRDIERGVGPSISGSLGLVARRKTYLGLFALMLTLIMAAWVRFSALVFAVVYNGLTPNADVLSFAWLGSDNLFAFSYVSSMGLLLAGIVFVFGAFAIPRVLDRDTDFLSAMGYSYRRVVGNLPAMSVWAAVIVILTAIGIATAFIGLAVIFPVLGFATWHSYRAVSE